MEFESTFSSARAPRLPLFNIRWAWVAVVVVLIAWSLIQAGVFSEQTLINSGGWTLALRFIQAAFQPQLSPEFLLLTLNASLITFAYALCGTSLSLIIGIVGGLLSSEVWCESLLPTRLTRAVWWMVRAALSVPRAIHEVIWGLFFVNVLGLNPLVAILAIAIPFGAITAKVFSEILDETPRAPLKALLNSGVSPLAAFFYSIVPQALARLLSYTFYRLECSIRSAAVLGVIGAGGLGYQIWLSFQSLRYNEMWTFIFALIALSGAVDMWSSQVRQRFNPSGRTALVNCGTPMAIKNKYRWDRSIIFSLLAVSALIGFSFWYVDADFTTLFAPRATKLLARVLTDSFPPTLDLILLRELSFQTFQTLAMSILAMAIAGVGGLVLSFAAAHNFMRLSGFINPHRRDFFGRVISATVLATTRLLLLTFRAIPASVWALLLLFVLFPGILPGAIALGVYTLGILGRLMAEVIENLDERPLQALKVSGASGAQVFFYGILPRAIPSFTSYVLYRWEVCARETVIVGVVGAAGLGRVLADQLSKFDYPSVATTLLFFVALTVGVDMLGIFARRVMR